MKRQQIRNRVWNFGPTSQQIGRYIPFH